MIAIADRIIDCEQGSGAWLQARLGCVTSSRIDSVIAKPKRVKKARAGEPPEPPKELESRRSMRFQLACELLTGRASEQFVSKWMKEGKELEPIARAEYEMRFGFDVQQIGLVYHATIKRAGCSPDGKIATGGLIEIKCPKVETHAQYIAEGVIPDDYLPQMIWQLACFETEPWNDFVSYCPDMPEAQQIFRKRLERTEQVNVLIRCYETETIGFNAEVDALLNKIRGGQ